MKTETVDISGIMYIMKLFYEDREYPSASIRKNSINIRIPLSMDRNQQFATILKMKQWAKEKIEKNPPKQKTIKEYKDGEILKVGDRKSVV